MTTEPGQLSIFSNLEVNAASLLDALKYLKRFGSKKQTSEVAWAFDGSGLLLQMGATQAQAEASGEWSGLARCSADFAFALIGVLPEEDVVTIWVEGDKLHVGNSSIVCSWEDRSSLLAYASQDIDLEGLLALRLRYSQEELERSHVINRVEEAERKRNNMLTRAVKALQPLGITRKDLLTFIEERLKRKYPQTGK